MSHFLVFDIETFAIDFNLLSESQQEYLVRRSQNDEEREQKIKEMALAPLTSKIACIGMQKCKLVAGSPEIESSLVLITNDELLDDEVKKHKLGEDIKAITLNEKELLKRFWENIAANPDAILLSFNGRNFDCPYMMMRSALKKVRPTRNLMAGTKFNYGAHIDLFDELTFFQPSNSGPTRRYNFDFYAQAFGIKSPKSEGVDGSMVSDLYAKGEYDIIAEYCMRDVKATWELFLEWNEYLNFSNKL